MAGGVAFGEDFAARAVPIELAAGFGDAAAGAVVEIGGGDTIVDDVLYLAFCVVPGMIVFGRWYWSSEGQGARMLAGIHRRKRKEAGERGRVSASGTGAGDSLVSDAVRCGSLVGRSITPMG